MNRPAGGNGPGRVREAAVEVLARLDELAQVAARLERDLPGHAAALAGRTGGERARDDGARAPFETTLRGVLLLAAYAELEAGLEAVCREVAGARRTALQPGDLAGRGVNRARTFLVRIGGVPLAEDSRAWQDVQALGELRNILVHRNGALRPTDQRVHALAAAWDSVDATSPVARFAPAFVPRALGTIRDFWLEVQAALDDAGGEEE